MQGADLTCARHGDMCENVLACCRELRLASRRAQDLRTRLSDLTDLSLAVYTQHSAESAHTIVCVEKRVKYMKFAPRGVG